MNKIYLTEDDNINVIADKIRKSTDSEINFIAFSRVSAVLSVINLKLLKQLAESLGKTLSISTNDDAVKMLAEKAEIKVNSISSQNNYGSKIDLGFIRKNGGLPPSLSVDSIGFKRNIIEKPFSPAQKTAPKISPEDEPESKAPEFQDRKASEFHVSGGSKKIFVLFFILAIAAIAGVGYVLLPTAQITIIPKTTPLVANFQFILNKNISALDKTNKEVPAISIIAEVEKSGQFTATGKKQVSSKASGVVTFYNNWSSSPQSLKINNQLVAGNGKIYYMTKSVVIPGYTLNDGSGVPGSVDAEVEAAVAGAEYNLEGAENFTLPALKRTSLSKYEKITAKSVPGAIFGGALGYVTVVSESDLKKAKDFLSDGAKNDLLAQLDEKKPTDLIMLPEAVSVKSDDVTSNVKIDQAASKFNASLKTSAIAFLFNPSYIKDMANDLLLDNETSGESSLRGKYKILDSPEIKYSEAVVLGSDKIKLSAESRATAYQEIDANAIKSKLLGKDIAEVESYVKNNSLGINKITITLWPSWAKKVSIFERNVDVKISLDTSKK